MSHGSCTLQVSHMVSQHICAYEKGFPLHRLSRYESSCNATSGPRGNECGLLISPCNVTCAMANFLYMLSTVVCLVSTPSYNNYSISIGNTKLRDGCRNNLGGCATCTGPLRDPTRS